MRPYDIARRERAFRAVLDGSFAPAVAARFELTPSTVTRRLERLDEHGELGLEACLAAEGGLEAYALASPPPRYRARSAGT